MLLSQVLTTGYPPSLSRVSRVIARQHSLLTRDVDIVILSVRLSVCPSVTLRYCIETTYHYTFFCPVNVDFPLASTFVKFRFGHLGRRRKLACINFAFICYTWQLQIIIIIIISTTMFMVLSSWQSHCESSPGSFDECRMAPKSDDLGCESACTGCQKLHQPSPFIITQPES